MCVIDLHLYPQGVKCDMYAGVGPSSGDMEEKFDLEYRPVELVL
jgi:hypothetical protein